MTTTSHRTAALDTAAAVGHKKGKVAGLRQAADLLVEWGTIARTVGDEAEARIQEDAAESLRQIADRLEEEG